MPAQRRKGKTCSFSFTPSRNLVSRKISVLPFTKLSVGPVDVLGLGDTPCSVLTTGTHFPAMQPGVLWCGLVGWATLRRPLQEKGVFLCRGGGLGSALLISGRFPLQGRSPGHVSWTGHSQLCSKVNKQDLITSSSSSTPFSESSHPAWNGNPVYAGCFWQIRLSLVTRNDWFLPFIPHTLPSIIQDTFQPPLWVKTRNQRD